MIMSWKYSLQQTTINALKDVTCRRFMGIAYHLTNHSNRADMSLAIPGLIVGATYGTLRTQTPVLFSIFSGAQWFAIGTTFFSIRSSLLNSEGLRNWWNLTRGVPLVPLPEYGKSTLQHPTLPSQTRKLLMGCVTQASD